MYTRLATLLFSFAIFSGGAIALADDPAPPKTHPVTSGPFEAAITLDAVIELQGAAEVQIKPEEWATFTVETAIAHGAPVKEGDLLVKFESKELDHEIEDLQFQVEAGTLAIKLARIELELLQKSTPLDLEAAERASQIAAEEWDFYQKQGEALARQGVEENLKSVREMVEGTQEELTQLEKMYKADDLTEETEEIILKRARSEVERATFTLKLSQVQHDRRLEHELPREKRQKEVTRDREALALAKAQVSLPLTLSQKQVELEKLEHGQKQLTQKLERLKKDQALLELKSPIAGVVVYGESERGKWLTTETMRPNLRRGGSITPHQVILTVVPTTQGAIIWTEIPEKDIGLCRKGQIGRYTETAYPDSPIKCELMGISHIFAKDSVYAAGFVSAEKAPIRSRIMTGMTGKMRLVVFSENDVIAVPSTTVFTDEDDSSLRYVYLAVAGGEPRMQTVEVGLSSATRTHIKAGLKTGDQILLTKPDSK
jgi:HlyD family secretion protein